VEIVSVKRELRGVPDALLLQEGGRVMALTDEITLEGEHGQYRARVESLDLVIARYLPASVAGLREIIRERTGEERTLTTIMEGLMILAELDGFATN
jgi:hypothetical protein